MIYTLRIVPLFVISLLLMKTQCLLIITTSNMCYNIWLLSSMQPPSVLSNQFFITTIAIKITFWKSLCCFNITFKISSPFNCLYLSIFKTDIYLTFLNTFHLTEHFLSSLTSKMLVMCVTISNYGIIRISLLLFSPFLTSLKQHQF